MRLTRRDFIRKTLRATAATGLLYTLAEPWRVEVEKITIRLPGLPASFEGFRIVQLSDLHYLPFTTLAQIGDVVDRTNSLKPDLVVITGDFVTGGHKRVGELTPVLERLRAPHGVTGILGNHDKAAGAASITATLRKAGLEMLRNEGRELSHGGSSIFLAGVDSICGGGGYPDLKKALAQRPPAKTTLLLAHEPDFADKVHAHASVALQLSGHTHGGQVCFPLVGALILPAWGKKYWKGLYTVNRTQLYTNRGIGTTGAPVRFGSLPEITEITLTAAPLPA
ncbi:MAG TPA: metallophosphoesterase [Chthoniobacterales bacterium]